jgi:hypothetical protein
MGTPDSAANWDIGLSAWIIQDGNYPDFEVGQTVEFAVEFWIPDGVGCGPSDKKASATNLGDCVYDAVAEIIFQTADITIFDIGFMAYRETSSLQQSLPTGSRIAVRLGLGIDPFLYFESLSKLADVPPLVYSWKIISILRQTAPLVETESDGRKIRIRDPQRLNYEEIRRTDAWNDDGGYAEYVLRCDLLPIPPERTSKTAM